jgi:hypothetical protein
MAKGTATESALGELHGKVAKVMTRALDQLEKQQDEWEQAQALDVVEPPPAVNPSLLSVMTKFLSDNKITCDPADSGAMSELEKKLAERRTKRRVGNVTHIFEE